jgi:dolichol-phosphate mannosyltransferase
MNPSTPTPETSSAVNAASSEPQQSLVSSAPRMTECERILVTIATYNEMENLPDLVRDVQEIVPAADFLLVDDNSPDGTGRWIAERAAADPKVFAIHRPHKLGLGSATMAALNYAVENDYTYVIAMDADGSHDPRYIPAMLDLIRQPGDGAPDVVIGSRYVDGGSTVGWPLYRKLMSRAVNGYARIMLGLPVRDCSGAFRCTRVNMLRRVDLQLCRSRGYAMFEELLWRFKQADAVFQEIPIVFLNRKHGQSKISLRESISAVWKLLCLGLRNWLRLA